MGNKSKINKLKDEVKFLKKVGDNYLHQDLDWTQTITPQELLISINYEKTLNQTLIFFLISLHVPFIQPILSIIMLVFVIAQAVFTYQYLTKLKKKYN